MTLISTKDILLSQLFKTYSHSNGDGFLIEGMCILMDTDYNKRIIGVGPNTNVDMLPAFGKV